MEKLHQQIEARAADPEKQRQQIAGEVHHELEPFSKDVLSRIESVQYSLQGQMEKLHRQIETPPLVQPQTLSADLEQQRRQMEADYVARINSMNQSLQGQIEKLRQQMVEKPAANPEEMGKSRTPGLEDFRVVWEKKLAALENPSEEPAPEVFEETQPFDDLHQVVQGIEEALQKKKAQPDKDKGDVVATLQNPSLVTICKVATTSPDIADEKLVPPIPETEGVNLLPDFDLTSSTKVTAGHSFFSWLKAYLNEPVIEFGQRQKPPTDTDQAA